MSFDFEWAVDLGHGDGIHTHFKSFIFCFLILWDFFQDSALSTVLSVPIHYFLLVLSLFMAPLCQPSYHSLWYNVIPCHHGCLMHLMEHLPNGTYTNGQACQGLQHGILITCRKIQIREHGRVVRVISLRFSFHPWLCAEMSTKSWYRHKQKIVLILMQHYHVRAFYDSLAETLCLFESKI